MPILLLLLGLVILFTIAKILTPILLAILYLFALLTILAPFLLFIAIGFFGGKFADRIEKHKEVIKYKLKLKNRRIKK